MIHSMSGGVMSDLGAFTFVKVIIDGCAAPYWYICDLDIEEGDAVIVPLGGAEKRATVLRVERNVSSQVAPVPVKRAKRVLKKL